MNRTLSLTVAAAACALIGNAFADDITIDPTPFVSSRTRAEVQQELKEYKASGIDLWADNYNPVAGLTSGKTRAQVRAEYLAERDKVAAFNGEDSGSVYLARAIQPSQDIQLAGDPLEPR
ncbi:MAG: hypothetical protein JWP22_617 [Ramlibacter sp.]|jgi:hypothetical protein|nr:hypothetical protein [Ramlibacter sp.]MDB5911942.1 hypothetical protein [Ramlibacter sp.]